MELFIGTKPVKAKPMRYNEYYALVHEGESDKTDEGYLVII